MVIREKRQKCYSCAKACGKCSWSGDFLPVPGWSAAPVLDQKGRLYSYQIDDCPEFVPDYEPDPAHKGCIRIRNRDFLRFDRDGMVKLYECFFLQLREEYRYAGKAKTRLSIERFLRSARAKRMFQYSDAEADAIVRSFRGMVRTP